MATERFAGAVFDTGAQFFTVRTPVFQAFVDGWMRDGVVREWCRGFGPEPDGFPRYIGASGMDSIAATVAADLDVQYGVEIDDIASLAADAVVVTAPNEDEYDPMLAALCVLDGESTVPSPRRAAADRSRRGSASSPTTRRRASRPCPRSPCTRVPAHGDPRGARRRRGAVHRRGHRRRDATRELATRSTQCRHGSRVPRRRGRSTLGRGRRRSVRRDAEPCRGRGVVGPRRGRRGAHSVRSFAILVMPSTMSSSLTANERRA